MSPLSGDSGAGQDWTGSSHEAILFGSSIESMIGFQGADYATPQWGISTLFNY